MLLELTISQLSHIKLSYVYARGLMELDFGDTVTNILSPGVADGGLLNSLGAMETYVRPSSI